MARTPRPTIGDQFEQRIASLYRQLGAQVTPNFDLHGSQIDLLVTEVSISGPIRTAVECKERTTKVVGVDRVKEFWLQTAEGRRSGAVHATAIVTRHGYSRPAQIAAETYGMKLLVVEDLERRVMAQQGDSRSAVQQKLLDEIRSKPQTSEQVAAKLGVSPRFVDDAMRSLKEDGKVFLSEDLRWAVERN